MEDIRIAEDEEQKLLHIKFTMPWFLHMIFILGCLVMLVCAILMTQPPIIGEIVALYWILFVFFLVVYIAYLFGIKHQEFVVTDKMIRGNQFILFGYKRYGFRFDTISNVEAKNVFGVNNIRLTFTQGYTSLERNGKCYYDLKCVADYEYVIEKLNQILSKVKNDKDVSSKLALKQTEALNNIASSMKNVPENNSRNNEDVVESIKKLKELLDSGIITQQEFEEKKKKLLEKI